MALIHVILQLHLRQIHRKSNFLFYQKVNPSRLNHPDYKTKYHQFSEQLYTIEILSL